MISKLFTMDVIADIGIYAAFGIDMIENLSI